MLKSLILAPVTPKEVNCTNHDTHQSTLIETVTGSELKTEAGIAVLNECAPSSTINTNLETRDNLLEVCLTSSTTSVSTALPPVSLVVEQTARILEEIKRKIQLQQKEKLEEEELRRKQQVEEEIELKHIEQTSPRYFTFHTEFKMPPAVAPPSFIILNHRYSADMTNTSLKPIPPPMHSSVSLLRTTSLSPDSGTDYGLLSASSSLSPPSLPPFKSSVQSGQHTSEEDLYKLPSLSRNSPGSLYNYNFLPTKSNLFVASKYPTTVDGTIRRFSGMSVATSASLAKSTPSISTDLFNEIQPIISTTTLTQQPTIPAKYSIAPIGPPPSSQQRPLSFQILPTTINQPPLALITSDNCSEGAVGGHYSATSQTPPALSLSSSSLDYPNYRFTSYSPLSLPPPPPTATSTKVLEHNVRSFDDNMGRITGMDKYNKFLQRQLGEQQQQPADFLSLSLSPPLNRRCKHMPALRGCSFVSL